MHLNSCQLIDSVRGMHGNDNYIVFYTYYDNLPLVLNIFVSV